MDKNLTGMSTPELLDWANLTGKTDLELELTERLAEATREMRLMAKDLNGALARLDCRPVEPPARR